MLGACLLFSLLITFSSCDKGEEEEDLSDLRTMVQAEQQEKNDTSSCPPHLEAKDPVSSEDRR
jgi:hypothetical protein